MHIHLSVSFCQRVPHVLNSANASEGSQRGAAVADASVVDAVLREWHQCLGPQAGDRFRESRPFSAGACWVCIGKPCIVCAGEFWPSPQRVPSLRIAEAHQWAAVGRDDADKMIDEVMHV
jgi:hypothetical protein